LDWPFTVAPRGAVQFNILVLLAGIALIALAIFVFVMAYVKLFGGFKRKKRVGSPLTEKNFYAKKQLYLKKLDSLEKRYAEGKVDRRGAYREMSKLVRGFIYDATGLRLLEMTYTDICKSSTPVHIKTASLIRDYYEPEFARMSDADTMASIQKTKKEILYWTYRVDYGRMG